MKPIFFALAVLLSTPFASATPQGGTWVIASAGATDPWTLQLLEAFGRQSDSITHTFHIAPGGADAARSEIQALAPATPDQLLLLGEPAYALAQSMPHIEAPSILVRVSGTTDRDHRGTQIIQRPNFGRELTLLRQLAPDIEAIALTPASEGAALRALALRSIARSGYQLA
ncbi:MAG: hypothetical protein ACPGUF_07885, partial [Litorivicinus sp.]